MLGPEFNQLINDLEHKFVAKGEKLISDRLEQWEEASKDRTHFKWDNALLCSKPEEVESEA